MNIGNSISQQQELKQTQILAPQQLASLSLLTLPVMGLEARINEELAANPVLEIAQADSEPEKKPDELLPEFPDSYNPTDAPDIPFDENREDFQEHLDTLLNPSNEYQERSEDSDARREYMFNSITQDTSLQESLLDQLRFLNIRKEVYACAEYVIGSLDDNGWFRGTLPDAAQTAGTDLETAEKALKLVQTFDPAGIAARDLKECLLLQTARMKLPHKNLDILIRDHLEELGNNKLPQIAKAMNISMDELQDLLLDLRALDPRPGSTLNSHNEPYILPEITVVPDGDSFVLVENKSRWENLSIARNYQKMLENPAIASADKAWIRAKIDSGKTLIHALEQRKRTIYRIAELIVNNQFDFMKQGPGALKPMTMRQAADKLGLHETTVSRAVSGKYLMTPFGLFEFKFFFSGGFQSEDGEEVSAHVIQKMIREFVNAENPAKPLSDSKLAEMLKEKGFEVARRTIAKYREQLGIQSSQMRKVF